MQLRIDRASATPLFQQIAGNLREQIASGLMPEGHRLPPERTLARELGVNRSTVLAAYAELKADGLVDAHVGRGTVVLPQRFAPRGTTSSPAQPFSWRQISRRSAASEPLPIIRDLLELASHQDVIPLSVGMPAPELLPLDAVREIGERMLAERGATALLHSPTEGIAPLRESVAALLASRGIECDPAEVLVTTGSQQGLDLVRRVLIDPGDVVVVEQPTFFGALEILRGAEARLVPVPVDADGMRVDVLEELLGRIRPKLIYTLPTFQNPSGASLSLERRKKLLALAYRYQVPIVEDDLYYDLRYHGAPLPTLRSLDRAGYVLYLSSISKVLVPGMRVGFLVAPRPFLRSLALAKQAVDLHSTTFGQWFLDTWLREGRWAPHVETVRQAYSAKRRIMLEALAKCRPAGLTWTEPAGGFYLWCRYPTRLAPSKVLARAARERVSFLPGEACYVDEPVENHLRLNFTFPSARQIRQGVERLGKALQAAAVEPDSRRAAGSETRPII
ncbi:MAG: PLP-dependent aminotransferase family protein [Deltaproteobacteria bacterium]|nr:PLP-dependent aminotransferase family protein [Deltaproteobacteria bacterium]